ncbi:hypothetical protein MJO28_000386 [Puccinia striiformis f. sp. tritici]|uniref:Uncharacterized protein n=1 Tax=Puccinia striiformis f. sp. tritici TaxID=168172 RepID=A0ACC0EY60_9BASI|nr:hypothetical protein MJO28_000386 [Puccinia striiformis f. sp. tritici]
MGKAKRKRTPELAILGWLAYNGVVSKRRSQDYVMYASNNPVDRGNMIQVNNGKDDNQINKVKEIF